MNKRKKPSESQKIEISRTQLLLCVSAIFVLSVITRVGNIGYPDTQIWDETYHIASAEKYLNGVFFLEPHPPLGKLIIAFGEYLIKANVTISKVSILQADQIKPAIVGMNYWGYRLLPALLGALSCVLFFLILHELKIDILVAFVGTGMIVLNNTLIVMTRAAMLEGSLYFFTLLSVWYCLRMISSKKKNILRMVMLGLLIGLAVSVKITSLFLVILLPAAVVINSQWEMIWKEIVRFKHLLYMAGAAATIGIVFVSMIVVHYYLAGTVVNDRSYGVSKSSLETIKSRTATSPQIVREEVKEYIAYMERYERKVPSLKTNSVNENGSSPLLWPFGFKPINLGWNKSPGGDSTRNLILFSNPLSSYLAFISVFMVLLSFPILRTRILRNVISMIRPDYLMKIGFMVMLFLVSYLPYMLITRVMYFYHFNISLMFGIILCCLLFGVIKSISKRQTFVVSIVSTAVVTIGLFIVYVPFTYYLWVDNSLLLVLKKILPFSYIIVS